jgi:periplasmic protein CpxP/Spy
MINYSKPTMLNTAALTALIGGLAIASPAHAVVANRYVPPASEMRQEYPEQPVYADTRYTQPAASNDMSANDMTAREMTWAERRHHQRYHGTNIKINNRNWKKETVESRINSLHAKLGITNAQEPQWREVAQVMRNNEGHVSQLIRDRHSNAESMTAIDDLRSYETIAQAHADGLHNLIPVFQALYNDMSDSQQTAANNAFNRFEGRRGYKAAAR